MMASSFQHPSSTSTLQIDIILQQDNLFGLELDTIRSYKDCQEQMYCDIVTSSHGWWRMGCCHGHQ